MAEPLPRAGERMYQIGEVIVYGQTGVCTVEAIGHPAGVRGGRVYYTLKPRYASGTVYVPVDAPVYSRKLLSPEEARGWITHMPEIPEQVCPDGRMTAQRQFYSEVLRSHDLGLLIGVVKGLYRKGHGQARNGRPLSAAEARAFRQAEELVHQELAASLGLEVEQVPQYVRKMLQAVLLTRLPEPPGLPAAGKNF